MKKEVAIGSDNLSTETEQYRSIIEDRGPSFDHFDLLFLSINIYALGIIGCSLK